MKSKEFDEAHEVLEQLEVDIIVLVRERIEDLTTEQKEYIVDKLGDEFRFWRAFP